MTGSAAVGAEESIDGSSTRQRLASRRRFTEAALVAVVLVLVGPVVGPRDAQAASREALTVSIVDHHTLRLDQERAMLSVDYATRGGHYYSDKAPLQPILAVPLYALYRALARPPSPQQTEGDLALWWMTLWTATVPAAALVVMTHRVASRRYPEVAALAALGIAAGTTVLPFGGMLFGHVLAGAFAFGSWALISSATRRGWTLPVAGLLAGAAVATEYPVAVVVVLLLVYASWRERSRVLQFIVGGAVPTVGLMAYQAAAFGSPLRPSYRSSVFVRHQHGLVGINVPNGHVLWRAMFGDRGLFLVTPVALVAVVGAAVLLRRRADLLDAALGLALLILFLLMQAGVDAYGGASPGPRFVVPMLSFLVVPLAAAWRRLPRLTWVATLVGCTIMLLALYTNPYPILRVNGPDDWLSFAKSGFWTHTIFTLHQRSGWPLLGMVAAAAALTMSLVRAPAGPNP